MQEKKSTLNLRSTEVITFVISLKENMMIINSFCEVKHGEIKPLQEGHNVSQQQLKANEDKKTVAHSGGGGGSGVRKKSMVDHPSM